MCHWEKHSSSHAVLGRPPDVDILLELNLAHQSGGGCPLVTCKQCSGMHCVKSEKNRAKPTDERRNVGKRPEPVREPVSKVSISLASTLRHHSASSVNVTLRDDGSRGE